MNKEVQEKDIQTFAVEICNTNPNCTSMNKETCHEDHFLCHPCKVHAQRLYRIGYRNIKDIKLTLVDGGRRKFKPNYPGFKSCIECEKDMAQKQLAHNLKEIGE